MPEEEKKFGAEAHHPKSNNAAQDVPAFEEFAEPGSYNSSLGKSEEEKADAEADEASLGVKMTENLLSKSSSERSDAQVAAKNQTSGNQPN